MDYAAPTGTPVRAAGDGRVRFAGRQGGYGNVHRARARAGVVTVYGHLSRFAADCAPASASTQGEIIGYVGMSGLATGPHLHYEYRVNGVHKNPQTVACRRRADRSRMARRFRAARPTLRRTCSTCPPARALVSR